MKPTITGSYIQAFWATLSIKILFGESHLIVISYQILTTSLCSSSCNPAKIAPGYHVISISIVELYIHSSMTAGV